MDLFQNQKTQLNLISQLFLLFLVSLLSGCSSNERMRVDLIPILTTEREREYCLYTPAMVNHNAPGKALVVVLHGGGGTAQFAVDEVGKSLFKIADRDGFYVVFPQAINKMWDLGAGRVSKGLKERVEDRTYFSAVLDDVAARVAIDPSRIFVTGISRGGQATYYMACAFPDRIRAIAPVAMPLPVHLESTCEAGRSIGVVIMNGTDDPLVPYSGGSIEIGSIVRDEVLSTDDTVALYASRNGGNINMGVKTTIDTVDDGVLVEKTQWRSCSGAPVILYSLIGGGHTWPSGRQYLPKFIVGKVSRDIDGAEEAWKFFSEFR